MTSYKGTPFYIEYWIKTESQIYQVVRASNNEKYVKKVMGEIDFSWIDLSVQDEGACLHKQIIHNQFSYPLQMQVMIQYRMKENKSMPFVYYSPHNEAMMVCGEFNYYLIGGFGPQGGACQYQTNSTDLDECSSYRNQRHVYQPISQKSQGWGMVYDVKLAPNSTVFLYDWQIERQKLYELETIHRKYNELLSDKASKSDYLIGR